MASQNNVVTIDRGGDPDLISLLDAEKLWGVKRQTIERLISENMINPARVGRKYRKDSLAQALILFYKTAQSNKREATEKDEADIRLKNAQAYRIELQNDETEGRLIPAKDHQIAVNELAIAVIDEFVKVESEIPGLLAETPDQEREFLPIVRDWVIKSKQRLADAFGGD
jgi:hypothetical protein